MILSKQTQVLGSSCGSVGRAVASDPMVALRIQSSANFYKEHMFPVNCIEQTKIKKEAGKGPFKKDKYRARYLNDNIHSFFNILIGAANDSNQ